MTHSLVSKKGSTCSRGLGTASRRMQACRTPIAFSLSFTFGPIHEVGRSRVIARAYEAVKRIERRLDRAVIALRPRLWTERRVRAIVDSEAARIDHYEIDDLTKVRIEEARNELSKSRERASRMAAFLTAQDEGFHGDEIQRLGAFARGVDLPGVVRSGTTDPTTD